MSDKPPLHWTPPLTADVVWLEPARGVVPAHLRPIVLGLYDLLQRPLTSANAPQAGEPAAQSWDRQIDPYGMVMRQGVGIPVLLGRPPADVARDASAPLVDGIRVVIALLDEAAFRRGGEGFTDALRTLAARAAAGEPGLLFVPVALHLDWLYSDLGVPVLDMTARPDADAVCRAVGVEIVTRGLRGGREGDGEGGRVSLFVSHTTADDRAAGPALSRLRAALNGDDSLSALFDLRRETREGVAAAMSEARQPAMLLVLHTDHYAESPRCEEEVLIAKQRGFPVVSVTLLGSAELRSPPYSANMSNLLWRDGLERAVLDHLLRVWLHHVHFARYGRAVARLVGLPVEPVLLSRPPELLDFAQGRIPTDRGALVLYPDPPLPTVETGVLQRAYPRVRLATPTTLFGCLLRPGHPIPPLAGTLVALSFSPSPDVPAAGEKSCREGVTTLHTGELTAYLTLCLVRAGAGLAYGGHLRRGGVTEGLVTLLRAHNQLGLPVAGSLRSYVAAHLCEEHEIGLITPPIPVGEDVVADGPAGRALQLSRMRERMATDCHAWIAMGGKIAPRGASGPGEEGYTGRFPGILEEAWRALAREKPLFVLGGFGGAAGWVADLLLDEPPAHPELLDEAALRARSPEHDALCSAYDAHPGRAPGDPASLPDLVAKIRALGGPLRSGSAGALWTNGLTIAENRHLFRSRSVAEIAHLVMKGLLRREAERARDRATQAGSKPVVRLYQGHAADAPGAAAYGLISVRGTPLSSAEAHLDERLGGALAARAARGGLPEEARASVGRPPEVELLPARGQRLSGDWVCVVSIDPPAAESAGAALSEATRELLKQAVSNGLHDLAVLPFGPAVGVGPEQAVGALIDALLATPNAARLTLTICEGRPARWEAVRRHLEGRAAEIGLVVLPGDPALAERAPTAHPVTLHTERIQNGPGVKDRLRVSMLAPADDSGPLALSCELPWSTFDTVGRAHRMPDAAAPPFEKQAALGAELLSAVLSPELATELARFAGRPLDVVHDAETAGVPWELLHVPAALGPAAIPALHGGVRRRLAVDAKGIAGPTGTCGATRRVLLILNPTGDLGGAAREGDALLSLLRSMPGLVVETLRGGQATLSAVETKLKDPWDVLHYAGHAYFEGSEQGHSGLCLADGDLTAEQVEALGRPPPFVFLNACQSGRVRAERHGKTVYVATGPGAAKEAMTEDVNASHGALARAFLVAGARLLIGNFWLVGDEAARAAARITYEQLLKGARAGAALMAARKHLFESRDADWVNYVLYGDSEWQW